MKKQDRIRICGARLTRFIYRFFIFVGMLALYSLVLGAETSEEGARVTGILALAGLAVMIAVGWFLGRQQRETDRSHQLAAEVALLFPDAPAAVQNREYAMRRRRELRVEALFYLILAVIAVFWLWAMHTANARPVSQTIGLLVILPGLLLTSIVLLVLSLIPRRNGTEMPEVTELDRQNTLRAMKLPDGVPEPADRQIVRNLSVVPEKEKASTAGEYLRQEKSRTRKNYWFLVLGMCFFFVCPLILFGFGILFVLADGPRWFFVFTGFLALVSTTLWVYITHMPGGMGTVSAARRRLKQLKSRKCSACIDTVLSHRMGADGAEIDFEQSGKVLFPCDSKAYDMLFPVPRNEAVVITLEDKIQSILILPAAEAAEPAAPLAANGVPAEKGNDLPELPLSDEALHQAALEEIARMSPSRRREIEAPIERSFDRIEAVRKKGYSDITSAERGELQTDAAEVIRKSIADLTLSSIEETLMETLKVSRSDIMNMKKNPFAASLCRRLLIAFAVEAVGIAVTAVIEKSTGASLGYVYVLTSVLSGSLAISCAESVLNMSRFRKLQKAYRDPEYRRKMLDAEIYKELHEQVKQRREQS